MGPLLMLDLRSGAVMLKSSDIQVGERTFSPMGPLLMLEIRSGAVMIKYSDIQVGEMIPQSHGTAADAGPLLRGCHDQVLRHTGFLLKKCALTH